MYGNVTAEIIYPITRFEKFSPCLDAILQKDSSFHARYGVWSVFPNQEVQPVILSQGKSSLLLCAASISDVLILMCVALNCWILTINLSTCPCSKLSVLLSSLISSDLPFSPYTWNEISASVPALGRSDVQIHSDQGCSEEK